MITVDSPEKLALMMVDLNRQLVGHSLLKEMKLMIGTSSTESNFTLRDQLGGGPAKGLFQMEPNTAKSIYNDFLKFRPKTYSKLMEIVFKLGSAPFFIPTDDELKHLLRWYDDYAFVMERLRYLWIRAAIPEDLTEIAKYYKLWYNTPQGKGSPEKFLADWKRNKCDELVKLVESYVDQPKG